VSEKQAELLEQEEERYVPHLCTREMKTFTAEWGSGWKGAVGVEEFHTKSDPAKSVEVDGRLMMQVIIDPYAKTEHVIDLLEHVLAIIKSGYWPDTISDG